jgi:2-iminobutanoate/2-iminopropanoate deaminase
MSGRRAHHRPGGAAMPRGAVALALLGLAFPASGQARQPAPTHFNPPGATAAYSAAVRVGDVLYFSGQLGMAADGSIPADIGEQAKLAMDRVANVAKLAGVTMDDVFKCTLMMTDLSQLAAVNPVYTGYFTPGMLPARSAFGVPALPLKAEIEIECLARAPE